MWLCATLCLLQGLTACGPEDASDALPLSNQSQAVESLNGLSTNGLSTNGLSTNGLSTNGLSTNGLSTNGFADWFNQEPELHATVMQYIVRCAVPAGEQRTFVNPATGVSHTWQGGLGLAPDWAQGSAATLAEQQVVSACLAAHANKYGIHIPISVLGRTSQGSAIPFSQAELATFDVTEAAFFGNLFDGSGLYVCNDKLKVKKGETSARACGIAEGKTDSQCAPLVHVGKCKSVCTQDSTKTYYTGCQVGVVSFRPMTTRIRTQEIYECGDGVCQVSETCGQPKDKDACYADCGGCP